MFLALCRCLEPYLQDIFGLLFELVDMGDGSFCRVGMILCEYIRDPVLLHRLSDLNAPKFKAFGVCHVLWVNHMRLMMTFC